MTTTYCIEENDGTWRLITLEKDEDNARSVRSIVEADDLADLNIYVDDLSQIERIEAHIDQLQEPYRSIKLKIDTSARLEYIRDCQIAVNRAKLDLELRQHELEQAINNANVG